MEQGTGCDCSRTATHGSGAGADRAGSCGRGQGWHPDLSPLEQRVDRIEARLASAARVRLGIVEYLVLGLVAVVVVLTVLAVTRPQ